MDESPQAVAEALVWRGRPSCHHGIIPFLLGMDQSSLRPDVAGLRAEGLSRENWTRTRPSSTRTLVRSPQIVDAYKADNTSVIVDDLVRDFNTIVKQVRYTDWNENQEGDRTVQKELRQVLKKFGLPVTGPLSDNAYGYVRENY